MSMNKNDMDVAKFWLMVITGLCLIFGSIYGVHVITKIYTEVSIMRQMVPLTPMKVDGRGI